MKRLRVAVWVVPGILFAVSVGLGMSGRSSRFPNPVPTLKYYVADGGGCATAHRDRSPRPAHVDLAIEMPGPIVITDSVGIVVTLTGPIIANWPEARALTEEEYDDWSRAYYGCLGE